MRRRPVHTVRDFFDRIGRPLSRSASLLREQKRAARDHLGSILTRDWKKVPTDVITTVDPDTLSEALQIYHSSFDTVSTSILRRYSAIFRDIFYVARSENRVVGYCVNYLRLSLSRYGIRKTAVIYSFAVDSRYRRHGIGTELLRTSIQEMRLNRIDEIRLYVSTKNAAARSIYNRFGFVVVRERSNVCGPGERCYEMRLAL